MSPSDFYRKQAAQQKAAADAATLENVRERCQRAHDAWAALAAKSERVAQQRAASQKISETSENRHDGFATAARQDGV